MTATIPPDRMMLIDVRDPAEVGRRLAAVYEELRLNPYVVRELKQLIGNAAHALLSEPEGLFERCQQLEAVNHALTSEVSRLREGDRDALADAWDEGARRCDQAYRDGDSISVFDRNPYREASDPFKSWRYHCLLCGWSHFANHRHGWQSHDIFAVEVHRKRLCPGRRDPNEVES